MKSASTTRLILYIVALFVAGGATGAMIAAKLTRDRMIREPSGQEMTARLRDKLISRLQLTPDQIAKVDPIIEDSTKQTQGFYRDWMNRIGQATKERDARIAALLTPAQQAKLEELQNERQEFIQKKCRPKSSGSADQKKSHQ
jgi:Spy/CpxP family protein refolding chaperone